MRKPLLTIILMLFLISGLFAQSAVKLSKADLPSWLKPISLKPQKINLDDISLGYYFEIIEEQYHLGLQTSYHNTVKVVSEESGAENAGHLNVSFDPSYQRLQIHRIQIERDGEIQNRLDLSKFKVLATESELSRFLYNGSYSAYMVLDDIRQGDKITFSYSLVGFNPVFEGKFFNTFYIEGTEPVGLIHLAYIVPDGRILNLRKHSGAVAEKKMKKDGLTYYYWEQASNPVEESSYYTPIWYSQTAKVEASEFSTWKQVSDWAKRVNPIPEIKVGSELDNFVNTLWKDAGGDKMLFFQRSLDFVQNSVRYMGIEMGENSHRAHAPEIVFKQRYGDCKDKSLLLAAMLGSKGIKSNLVLANTYQDKELDKLQPSPGVFNHMVLAVTIDEEVKPVDPTITNQAGPVMKRFFPYYGKILNLGSGNHLDEFRKDVPEDYLIQVVDVIELLDGDKANLSVTTTYKSVEADQMRTYFKENAKNQVQKEYENYYKKLYNSAKSNKTFYFEDDKEQNVIKVFESYLLDKYLLESDEGSRKMAPAFSKTIYDRLPEVDDSKLLPISLSFPSNVEHIIKIVNKDKSPVGSLSLNDFVERNSYFYSQSLSTDNDTLIIKNVFITNDSFIPTEESAQYVEDYTNLQEKLLYTLYVNDEGQIFLGDLTDNKINKWALWAFVVIMGTTIWFILKKYNKSKPTGLIDLEHFVVRDKIDGWLIILAIGLFVSVIYTLVGLFSQESPINAGQWSLLSVSNMDNKLFFTIYLCCWLIFTAVIFVFNVYSIYLFFKRRDIFPQTYFVLILADLGFVILTCIFVWVVNRDNFAPLIGNNPEIMRGIFYSIVWSVYIYRSKQVKETFTVGSDSNS